MRLISNTPESVTFAGPVAVYVENVLHWASKPYYCPHCGQGQKNLHEIVEWHCEPLDEYGKPLGDPLAVANPTEWQCHSDECQGRSFWA